MRHHGVKQPHQHVGGFPYSPAVIDRRLTLELGERALERVGKFVNAYSRASGYKLHRSMTAVMGNHPAHGLGMPFGSIRSWKTALGRRADVRCMTALRPKAEVHPRSCYVAKVPGCMARPCGTRWTSSQLSRIITVEPFSAKPFHAIA